MKRTPARAPYHLCRVHTNPAANSFAGQAPTMSKHWQLSMNSRQLTPAGGLVQPVAFDCAQHHRHDNIQSCHSKQELAVQRRQPRYGTAHLPPWPAHHGQSMARVCTHLEHCSLTWPSVCGRRMHGPHALPVCVPSLPQAGCVSRQVS